MQKKKKNYWFYRLFIDGLLFQCFELQCACTYCFTVKTLRFTVGAKRVILQLNCCKNLYHQSRRENMKITVNIKVIRPIIINLSFNQIKTKQKSNNVFLQHFCQTSNLVVYSHKAVGRQTLTQHISKGCHLFYRCHLFYQHNEFSFRN